MAPPTKQKKKSRVSPNGATLRGAKQRNGAVHSSSSRSNATEGAVPMDSLERAVDAFLGQVRGVVERADKERASDVAASRIGSAPRMGGGISEKKKADGVSASRKGQSPTFSKGGVRPN